MMMDLFSRFDGGYFLDTDRERLRLRLVLEQVGGEGAGKTTAAPPEPALAR
jgi:hypothetical protein